MQESKINRSVSRRRFLIAAGAGVAGIVVGGVVGSQLFPRVETLTSTVTTTTTATKTTTTTTTATTTATSIIAKYPCPFCDKEFSTENELSEHIRTEHAGLITKEVTKPPLTLIINGKKYELYDVEPNVTLQRLLHDVLGITSVKDMCSGRGECGSCTVLVDGRPILSCLTLALECDGKEIWTAEGIAQQFPELAKAWADHDAMQCGYCTPGVIVTVKALLDRKPNPTKEEILDFLSGNLCVCGTYPVWPKAVQAAAEKLAGKLGG
jgi:aerobic-type carbon monoxide dehydrogenase small subunit (CoxS/CutS family)